MARLRIGPSARRLLEEYALNPESVVSTGPLGNLLKSDVLEHITTKKLSRVDMLALLQSQSTAAPERKSASSSVASTSVPSPHTDFPVTAQRSARAKQLLLSKSTVPHAYANVSCRMDEVLKLQKLFQEKHKLAITIGDFVLKAAALSLQNVPEVNTIWKGDDSLWCNDINVCYFLGSDDHLLINNANLLGLHEISTKIQDFTSRLEAGQLTADERHEGTFSVLNLGKYGINHFTTVINPPQCSALAIGANRSSLDSHGEIATLMTAQLSYDSRVIDDRKATEFLDTFREILEYPEKIN